MKATELMIGDWVVCSDPTPFQIKSIEYDGTYYQVVGDDGIPVDMGDLNPIFITKDILYTNGFTDVSDRDFEIKLPLDNYCFRSSIEVFYASDSWVVDICRAMDRGSNKAHTIIRYVHELQHALRLCGLDEMADQFKIN